MCNWLQGLKNQATVHGPWSIWASYVGNSGVDPENNKVLFPEIKKIVWNKKTGSRSNFGHILSAFRINPIPVLSPKT